MWKKDTKKPKANSGRHRNLARDPHNFINDFDYPRHSITKEAYIVSLYYYFSSFTKEFFIVNRRFTKMTFLFYLFQVLQTTKSDSNDPAENKNTSMRELLSNLASQSNVHGISSLAGDKSAPLKFFWGLAFLGLLAFAVFQLYTIGTIYYSFPVKTKVKMEFKPLPFPAITICNMNTIRRSKIYDVQSNTLQQMLNVSLLSLYFKNCYWLELVNTNNRDISFLRNDTI